MALLDAVIEWDALTIHAIGERHELSNHPLISHNGLHAVHLAEYGAQAAAVHGALLTHARDDARRRSGRLVSLRDVQLAVEYIDMAHGRLDVHAECVAADEYGANYAFEVGQRDRVLASGRVMVMYTAV